jgi:hypothetical protein
MASAVVDELKKKSDTAAANLARQLQDMDPYLDKSDAPGEWTTRTHPWSRSSPVKPASRPSGRR